MQACSPNHKTLTLTKPTTGHVDWTGGSDGGELGRERVCLYFLWGKEKYTYDRAKKHVNGTRYVTNQFYKCTHPNDSEWWITLTQHHKSIFSLPYKKKFMQFLNPSLQPESKTVNVRSQGTGILTILSYKTMTKSDNDSKKIKKYASQFPQNY